MAEFVLFHRLADADSAAIRRFIVEHGLKSRVDFQNVDSDGAGIFAALGARRAPALWDGAQLHEGADAIRLALGAIIAAEAKAER